MLAFAVLTLGGVTLLAKQLPSFTVDQLVPQCDLIIIGEEVRPSVLEIDEVLKGRWRELEIKVRDLQRFAVANPAPGSRRPSIAHPELVNRVVVCLSLRQGPPTIVANGVYRVRRGGAILGYGQVMNPGGYELLPNPLFESLEELEQAVDTALAAEDRRQDELMELLSQPEPTEDFELHLLELRQLTGPGDDDVVKFIGRRLAAGGRHSNAFRGFLRTIPSPLVFPILREDFERTRDADVLHDIGTNGDPAARDFLANIVREPGGEQRRRFALTALSELYAALDRKEDRGSRDRVCETIFALCDEVPFAATTIAWNPEILGRMPHEGSVRRLDRMLARARAEGDSSEHEIEAVLRACRVNLQDRSREWEAGRD